MIQYYDIFNQAEKPAILLCNPNKDELYSLGNVCYNTKVTIRYNGLGEMSFTIPQKVNGETVDAYSYVVSKRVVYVKDISYFIITEVNEKSDGQFVNVKEVKCSALEFEMNFKKITLFGGTYKFYDPITPENGLIGFLLSQYAPNWSVGDIDADLWNKFRTFDTSDSTLYNFLMGEVATAYGCVFTFNTLTRTVNAVKIENATEDTDIIFNFENALKSIDLKEISDEITTALYVYGGGDLDIRTVNPLGTNIIYNFDYFKTTDWMSQGLIDAIDTWEALIVANQTYYADNLSLLKTKNASKVVLQSELTDLNSEYLALEGVQKVRIQSGVPYSDITTQMNAKQAEINAKEAQITVATNEIAIITENLTNTNTLLSFDNNFTPSQYSELVNFIYENTYQNENIIQTDSMSADEIQEQAQNLYNQGLEVLERISQPRYELDIEAINILAIKEFQHFNSQLNLGSVIYVNWDTGNANLVLLEMTIDYDNPASFDLTFGNRLRLDNSGYIFSDLFGQAVKAGSSVSFNSSKWANWGDEYKSDVTSFINSSLDASLNNIINATNQEILINQNGLKGRTFDTGLGDYSPKLAWLTSNTLAFTEDGWNTASLALGEITFNGNQYFGLVSEAIVGNLIAGESLVISNTANNFTLNESGATLSNASFTILSNDNKSRIYLNPTQGIRVQGNVGGTWTNKFYVNSSGDVVFAGSLSGASGSFSGTITANSGTIGGWTINSSGITNGVDYINSNGNIKLGALTITGGTATFSGTIFADHLSGQIVNGQIGDGAVSNSKVYSDLSAGKVTNGTMSGNRLYGGTASLGGMDLTSGLLSIYSSGGAAVIDASGSSTLRLVGSGGAYVEVFGGAIQLNGSVSITSGDLSLTSVTDIYVPGGTGVTTSLTVSTPSGNRVLRFSRGICYGT